MDRSMGRQTNPATSRWTTPLASAGELTGEGIFITLFSSLYNAEISLLRSNFLVDSRRSDSASEKRRVIDTGRLSPSMLHALASADILVLSSGPWWHEGEERMQRRKNKKGRALWCSWWWW